MAKSSKLYTYTQIDDRTPIQKLTLGEQFRVLLRQFTKSDKNELATEDSVTHAYLTMRANLLEFINKATKTIREGKHTSVTMKISNQFDPVLEEVLSSPNIVNYYNVTVERPKIDYDIVYFIKIRLEVKPY